LYSRKRHPTIRELIQQPDLPLSQKLAQIWTLAHESQSPRLNTRNLGLIQLWLIESRLQEAIEQKWGL